MEVVVVVPGIDQVLFCLVCVLAPGCVAMNDTIHFFVSREKRGMRLRGVMVEEGAHDKKERERERKKESQKLIHKATNQKEKKQKSNNESNKGKRKKNGGGGRKEGSRVGQKEVCVVGVVGVGSWERECRAIEQMGQN